LRRLSNPRDLIVVGQRPGSSALLYYSGRKGWAFEDGSPMEGRKIIEELEDFRNKGARYFLVASGGAFSYDLLRKDLDDKYELLEYREDEYIIYKLD